MAKLDAAGYAGVSERVSVEGRDWVRVGLDGFATRADAQAVLDAAQGGGLGGQAWQSVD